MMYFGMFSFDRGILLQASSYTSSICPVVSLDVKLNGHGRFIMPPTLKKLMGHIAFGACVGACVRACVGAWVGHTFCTYCNF